MILTKKKEKKKDSDKMTIKCVRSSNPTKKEKNWTERNWKRGTIFVFPLSICLVIQCEWRKENNNPRTQNRHQLIVMWKCADKTSFPKLPVKTTENEVEHSKRTKNTHMRRAKSQASVVIYCENVLQLHNNIQYNTSQSTHNGVRTVYTLPNLHFYVRPILFHPFCNANACISSWINFIFSSF